MLEPGPAEPTPEVDRVRARLIAAEFERARATSPPAQAGPPRRAPARPADQAALHLEEAMTARRSASLESELAGARRELADAGLELADAGRELAEARHELEEQRRRNVRAYEAIQYVRRELEQIRAAALERATTPDPAPPEPALEAAPPAPAAPAAPAAAARTDPGRAAERRARPVAPGRPSARRARPRGAPEAPGRQEPTEPTPERLAKPWLGKAFRTLAARDPSQAGRLLLALLPAQRAADPQPVAYDLVLGDLACARVTVSSTGAQIDLGDTPRPLAEVDFELVGDLASIARLLAAGPVRAPARPPAFRHRLARVRGDRDRLGALERLIDAPLTLGQLHAAGVRLDPVLAMTVAALMIEPAWTAGERFTIAHREPACAGARRLSPHPRTAGSRSSPRSRRRGRWRRRSCAGQTT